MIMICLFFALLNFLLAVIKVYFGLLCNSTALFSDGLHSFTDVGLNICVLFGIKLKGKWEPIMGIVISTVLITVTVAIAAKGIESITEKANIDNFALIIIIICIVIKELMFVSAIIIAKKQNSLAICADAWHQQSDAFADIGVLIGLFGAKIGIFWLEPLSSLLICIIISNMAIKIFKKSAKELECSNS